MNVVPHTSSIRYLSNFVGAMQLFILRKITKQKLNENDNKILFMPNRSWVSRTLKVLANKVKNMLVHNLLGCESFWREGQIKKDAARG